MVKRPIDAFVKYFLDVKPYHTKILEVVEQYLFKDDVNITIKENSFFYEQFINDPVCDDVGFGLEFDDSCGFSAFSCCTTFDCSGGFGLVYDNSDLMVSAPVAASNEVEGSLTLLGDHRYDTHFQIKEVSSNTISIFGDARQLLDMGHLLFIVEPKNTIRILEVAPSGFWVSGNMVAKLQYATEITVQRSQGNDGVYSITGGSYDVTTDRTFIAIQQSANLFQGSYNSNGPGIILIDSNTKNNGVYQRTGYVYQAPTISTPAVTILTVAAETPVLMPSETSHGSVVFRTAMSPGRSVWLNDGSGNLSTMSETKIINTEYNLDTTTGIETTEIFLQIAFGQSSVAEDAIDLTQNLTNLAESGIEGSEPVQQVPLTSSIDLEDIENVELRGYFFGGGFDGEQYCSPPIHSNVQAGFSEYLQINIISDVQDDNIYFIAVSEDFVPPSIEPQLP